MGQTNNNLPTNQSNPSTPNTTTGPLADLYGDPTQYSFTAFPSDIADGNFSRGGHYINFYINSSQSSSYLNNKTFTVATNKQGNSFQGSAAALQKGDGVNVTTNIGLTRPTKRITSAITLFTPDTINFQQSAQWEDMSLTEAMGGVGAFAQGANSMVKSIKDTFKEHGILSAIFPIGALVYGAATSSAGKEAMASLATKLPGGLVGQGAKDFAFYSSGKAINPQMEVLFKGVDFRTFQFDFLLSPKSEAEAEAIKQIVKTFRFHMAPEIGAQNNDASRYFIMPSEFDIQFMFRGQENTNIQKISTCVLQNMNVDYAPNGWSTYNDGFPVQTRMTLQFKEVEIMTKQRVDQGY